MSQSSDNGANDVAAATNTNENTPPEPASNSSGARFGFFGLFRRVTQRTRRTRSVFREISVILNALRAPIIVSIIGVIVFAFPGQIREIYRVMAEAFRFEDGLTPANFRFGIFFVMLYVTGYGLWYISRVLTLASEETRRALTEPDADGFVARWGPRIIGAAPAIASSYGMARAEMQRPDSEFATPELYYAAAGALLIGLFRLWVSWRRTRHNRQLYDNLTRSLLRYDGRLALSVLLLSGVAYLMTQPVVFTQYVGALSIICFFMIALVYGWSHLTFLYDRYAIPALTILVGCALAWSLFDMNDNHHVRRLQWTQALSMADAPIERDPPARERSLEPDIIGGVPQEIAEEADRELDSKLSDQVLNVPELNGLSTNDGGADRVQRGDDADTEKKFQDIADKVASFEENEAGLDDESLITPLTVKQAFNAWYYSRADRKAFEEAGKDYPVYIIAAQGGGMYAAYQTAMFMAQIQDECPNFAQHVFAISGVSGGAVGGSVFTGLALENAANGPVSNEHPCGLAPSGDDTNIAGQVDNILAQDFLSPLISGMLFGDFTARFSPRPIPQFDRARALEKAFEAAWARAEQHVNERAETMMKERGGEALDYRRVFDGDAETNPLRNGVLSYWRYDGAAPALFFNTTQVENGERMVISPIPDLGDKLNSYALNVRANEEGAAPDIRLSTAMVLSARFPYITPAGAVSLRQSDDRDLPTPPKARLVDGGYFENSGVETAIDIMTEFETRLTNRNNRRNREQNENRERRRRILDTLDPKIVAELRAARRNRRLPVDFRLIVLDLTEDQFRPPNYSLGESLSPVKAILNARVSRAQLASARARDQLQSPCRYMLVGGLRAIGRGASADESCAYSEMKDSQVWSVSLNDHEYDFQLGWILSRSALQLIQRQLGDPDSCNLSLSETEYGAIGESIDALQEAADGQVARHNSCVASFIVEQLRRGL